MPATSAALLQQTLPLLVLILLPLCTLKLFAFIRPRIRNPSMALGALLPWNWGYSSSSLEKERDHGKKRRVRTRADQVAESDEKKLALDVDSEDVHFPGLVNMSGTHCFMNSTLQALASLSALPSYLLSIRTRAEALDVPTPVVDALLDLLAALNTPTAPHRPLRATALVEALCAPPPVLDSASSSPASTSNATVSAFWGAASTSGSAGGSSAKAAALLASHEHQDAQELFQLLSECVREEGARVAREGGRGRGFAGVGLGIGPGAGLGEGIGGGEGKEHEGDEDLGTVGGVGADGLSNANAPSPFDGLTATRRACVRCGYTAAIRHFSFDSVQLAIESAGGGWGGTTLPALLRAYTALEILQDCPCRRCALRATARRLREEVARLEEAAPPQMVNGMLVENASRPLANGLPAANDALLKGQHLANGHAAAPSEEDDYAEDGEEEEMGREGKGKKHKSKKHRKDKDKEKDKPTPGEGPTPSRLRRLKAVRRMEARVLRALEAGRIEEEELEGEWDWGADGSAGGGGGAGTGTLLRGTGDALKGVRLERVAGGVCTRQSMLGRPPAILALHINRSVHTGIRVAKNSAHVAFPEILDLAPYTTGGVLNLDPTAALSGAGPSHSDFDFHAADAPVSPSAPGEECLYRLAAAVCHFGQHSFGHYICYRRAPQVPPEMANSPYAPSPPTREESGGTGAGWLRISDARVDRCGVEQVLSEGSAVFMLYYERVPPPPPPPQPSQPQVYAGVGEADSAETLKPGQFTSTGAGMAMSLSGNGSGSGSAMWSALEGAKPRVVRSVSLGMSSRASVSSSSLSLRSTSSVSLSPAPPTPRARAVDEDAAAAQTSGLVDVKVEAVEPLALREDDNAKADGGENGEGDDDARTLPTPPPTPKSGSQPPPAVPMPMSKPELEPEPPTKTQKARKKKKKGTGKQEQAQVAATTTI